MTTNEAAVTIVGDNLDELMAELTEIAPLMEDERLKQLLKKYGIRGDTE